jgi:hypothetical protein
VNELEMLLKEAVIDYLKYSPGIYQEEMNKYYNIPKLG